MKRARLTKNQYALNHPAGQIGRRLTLCVKDVMLTGDDIPVVHRQTPLAEAIPTIAEKKCGGAVCVDEDERIVGVFGDGDIRRALNKYGSDALQVRVEECMTKDPLVTVDSSLAHKALLQMEQERKVSFLPVIDCTSRKLVGLVTLHSLISSGL